MRTQQIPRTLIAGVQGDAKVFSTFLQLKKAHELAAKFERSLAQVAVDMALLTRRGGSRTAIQWLLSAGLAEHFRKGSRVFRPRPQNARITQNSCFLLSERGLELAQQFNPGRTKCHKRTTGHKPSTPFWDNEACQLWYGDRLVKVFGRVRTQPGPNSTGISAATMADPDRRSAARSTRHRSA